MTLPLSLQFLIQKVFGWVGGVSGPGYVLKNKPPTDESELKKPPTGVSELNKHPSGELIYSYNRTHSEVKTAG